MVQEKLADINTVQLPNKLESLLFRKNKGKKQPFCFRQIKVKKKKKETPEQKLLKRPIQLLNAILTISNK